MGKRLILGSVLAIAVLTAAAAALDVRDVNRMLSTGVSEGVIINMVQNQGTPFNLTPSQVVELSRNGASQRLIDAMTYGSGPAPTAPIMAPPSRHGPRGGGMITSAPIVKVYSPPPLMHKQGWLEVSNRDWIDYTLTRGKDDRLFLSRGAIQRGGGIIIPSGATVALALEKDDYDLYGESPEKLKVDVREGRTTTLSLDPFGPVEYSGLTGVVNDGKRVRSSTLFESRQPPVVVVQPAPPPVIVQPAPRPVYVQPAPVVVVRPAPPPPPPVIVRPPPVVVRPAPPPPPPPPYRRDKGWGFSFFYGD